MDGGRESGRRTGIRDRLYGMGAEAARVLLPAAGALRPALAAGLAERRDADAAMSAWSERGRRPDRPLLWLHGASAGELVGAAPVVEALRRRGALQLAVTYFSASGAPAARELEPDYAGHPPLDALGACRRALDALEPTALVFAKLDVWPGLVRAAAGRGVPVGLVNGTVRPDSSRLRAPARWLLAPAYGRLARAGAVSAPDGERLRRLGVPAEALRVTGDAAFDRALERADRAARESRGPRERLLRALGDGPPTLLAGSTWPEDEELLLEAAAVADGAPFRLVLAPHRPTREAVERLARRCDARLGRPPHLWSRVKEGAEPGAGPDVLVVDAVGVLADLYTAADFAWVGGGFGDDGLHAVVEPAAAGIPVLFGPRHSRREARELVEAGAALSLEAEEAVGALRELASDPERRWRMGARARAYVESGRGAAEAGAALVAGLMAGEAATPRGAPGPRTAARRSPPRG